MLTQEFLTGAVIGGAITSAYFGISLFLGDKTKYRMLNCTAYCFECEIEMPIKQNIQTGQIYCTNCGTLHIQNDEP